MTTTTMTDEQRISMGAALADRLDALKELHAIVAERIARQRTIDETLRAAVERAGSEAAQESAALRALSDASEDAVKRGRLIALKLETAQLEGQLSQESYQALIAAAFPAGLGVVGATPGDRFQALRRIAAALEKTEDADKGGLLRQSAEGGATALEKANADAKREGQDKSDALDKLGQARVAWDDTYAATRDILSGLLREAGRLKEHAAIFPDASPGKR